MRKRASPHDKKGLRSRAETKSSNRWASNVAYEQLRIKARSGRLWNVRGWATALGPNYCVATISKTHFSVLQANPLSPYIKMDKAPVSRTIQCVFLGQNCAYLELTKLALSSAICLTKPPKIDVLPKSERAKARHKGSKYFQLVTWWAVLSQEKRSFRTLLSILFCLVAKKHLFCADWSDFPILNLVVHSSFY